MIRLGRKVSALANQTVATNGTNGALIVDTRPTTGERFEAAMFDILIGPGAATTALATCRLVESTSTNLSAGTALYPFVGGTATSATVGFVIPTQATSAATLMSVHFNVNLRKTKARYLIADVVPGGTNSNAVAITASLLQPNQSIAANTTGSGGTVFVTG